MKRQIALDTETTGLEVQQGHRLVEIACVEMIARRVTGNTFHTYLNPDRAIDEGARRVTGIADEFLLDKPHFVEVADEFLAFIDGAELVIHNASFDIGFLDAELAQLDGAIRRVGDHCAVLDTLALARHQYPGQRNNLDALCRRLGVDNSRREMHGGLIDAQLLADVYLAMTSGQDAFNLGFAEATPVASQVAALTPAVLRARPQVLLATDAEQLSHEQYLDALDKELTGGSVWRRLEQAESAQVSESAPVPL